MDDKDRILRLYYRLATIQGRMSDLKSDIKSLEEELESSFVIDGKPMYKSKTKDSKEKISDVNSSISSVRHNLRSNLWG